MLLRWLESPERSEESGRCGASWKERPLLPRAWLVLLAGSDDDDDDEGPPLR
jgi:hypothetical protein